MRIKLPRYIHFARIFDRVWPLTLSWSLIACFWMLTHLLDDIFGPPHSIGARVELLLATSPPMLSLIASMLLRRSVPTAFLARQGKIDAMDRLLKRTFGPLVWQDLVSAAEDERTASRRAVVLSAQRRAAIK